MREFREFIRWALLLLCCAAVVTAALSWLAVDRPNRTIWMLRIGAPVAMVLFAFALVLLLMQRSKLPDVLGSLVGSRYFDRGGFCFAPFIAAVDGTGCFCIYFQNQHSNSCHARLVFRATDHRFVGRQKQLLWFDIDCPGAAFGFAHLAISVPQSLQGRRQKFEVGATVNYPQGRGHLLRYCEGITLRSDAQLKNAFHEALAVGAFFTGDIREASPATATLTLPAEVSSLPSLAEEPMIEILWEPGDPLPVPIYMRPAADSIYAV